MITYLIYFQESVSLLSGYVEDGRQSKDLSRDSGRYLPIGECNFVGEGVRGYWQFRLCEDIWVAERKLSAHFWLLKANGNDSRECVHISLHSDIIVIKKK